MNRSKPIELSKFMVAGINYKKTDAAIRGQFAVSNEQYETILSLAPSFHVQELFILSTCNRTEIYGLADDVSQLVDLLCTQTTGTRDTFNELSYVKKGTLAIQHLFNVAAGLDSQILGDYEIVGQIKLAVKFSREHGFIQAFTERLFNCVLQSSKSVKNNTEISGGTVSVSFAAVQCIREKFQSVADKKILLIGTGKIGRNTCKNLVDYLDTRNITLINRSDDKATSLAQELGLQTAGFERLAEQVQLSDIIIVATNSETPVITRDSLLETGEKLLIDLSIPHNIEASSRHLSQVTLLNVDDLAKINDATLQKREAEIPKAKQIIDEHMSEFMEWHEMRKHVPVLKAVKTKLTEINKSPLFTCYGQQSISLQQNEETIQKVINGMAIKMRSHNNRGCHYLEAIHDFIAISIH